MFEAALYTFLFRENGDFIEIEIPHEEMTLSFRFRDITPEKLKLQIDTAYTDVYNFFQARIENSQILSDQELKNLVGHLVLHLMEEGNRYHHATTITEKELDSIYVRLIVRKHVFMKVDGSESGVLPIASVLLGLSEDEYKRWWSNQVIAAKVK